MICLLICVKFFKLMAHNFLLSDCSNVVELVSGDLPVVISCASLALADAGIMMYDLIASVSVVWILLISSFLSSISLFCSER